MDSSSGSSSSSDEDAPLPPRVPREPRAAAIKAAIFIRNELAKSAGSADTSDSD